MKIKTSTLVLIGIIYCLACQCKWLAIIGLNSSICLKAERVVYILLFLYCRFGNNHYKRMRMYYKKIDKGLAAIFIVGLIEFVYTIAFQNTSFDIAIENSVYAYVKLLAVYPILYLFVYYGYEKVQKIVIFVCGSSMIYQAAVAFLFNSRGIMINNSMIANDEWVRNGNIRLGSTSLVWVLFIILFCRTINETYFFKKSRNAILCILAMAFMLLVNQSRSLYVAATGAAIFVYLFHERRSKGKVFALLALFVFVVVFTQSSVFNNFIASFSKGAADDTLTGRLELLGLIQQAARNKVFGFGFVGSTTQLFGHVFYFIDYGIIGDLLQLGIFAAALYLVTGIILLQNSIVLSRHKGFGFDFTVGALGFLIIGAIGFTVLSTARNFAIPVILAISQYSAINYVEENV